MFMIILSQKAYSYSHQSSFGQNIHVSALQILIDSWYKTLNGEIILDLFSLLVYFIPNRDTATKKITEEHFSMSYCFVH